MTMTAKKKKVEGWTEALPRRLNEFQATVEKRVRKGLDQVTEMLPPEPRKAVKRMTAEVERVRTDLRKRGMTLRKRGEKMVADTRKRGDKVLAETRKRGERLTAEFQKRMEGAITPLTKTLDLASRTEVERLRKRLDHLERRMEVRTEHAPA